MIENNRVLVLKQCFEDGKEGLHLERGGRGGKEGERGGKEGGKRGRVRKARLIVYEGNNKRNKN